MNTLSITLCKNPEEAIARGFSKEDKYKEATNVNLQEVVIVAKGTVNGRSTLDLILTDSEGKTYVSLIPSSFIASLYTILKAQVES